MKHFFNVTIAYFAFFTIVIGGAFQMQALAQCCGGACYSNRCYSNACYSGGGYCYSGARCANACYGARSYVYAPTYGYYQAPTVSACGNVSACGSCETVTACNAVDETKEETRGGCCACDPCACSSCECSQEEPVAACAAVEKTECYGGVCVKNRAPLRSVAVTSYLTTINAARAARGLAALVLDPILESGAQAHAANMARYGALYHAANGCAENCAQNNGVGIDGAVVQWERSAGHAANMFNPNYTRAGVGVFRDAYGRNWCVLRLR